MGISRTDMLALSNEAGNGSMRDTGKLLRAVADGDLTGGNQVMIASGAVTPYTTSLHVRHASVVVAATVADASKHRGIFAINNSSASGTAAHTVTLSKGTFDGTNNRATLDAPGEALIVSFDEFGAGQIVLNVGSVGLSAV